ncbi:uncharacterized protein BO87DRAFT_322949, partial [Aspergillus neoniger CBS 115656]
ACKPRYATSTSGTNLLSTFAGFTCVVEQINQMVSRIASNTNLAQRGFELGLDRYICKNPSQGNFVSDKLMATTVEAIAGAVFVEISWVRVALQRIVDALGLAWPDS